ncbi:TPA: hypothetical protein ACH3X1_011957 [Trebouxia sp. C0004]
MSLFLQRPTSSAVRAVSADSCALRHDRLARFQRLLQESSQSGENTDRHTLRLWLISAASKLEGVQPSRTWGRLEPLLRTGDHSSDTNHAFGIYLLQLVCDVEPTKVGRLLAHHPRIIRHFFRDHPQHISVWFQSSYVGSISEFRNGAKALAQYALLHRAEMWDLLVWQGKHPQAPVAVAAKPYYFSELNIHQSVLNILKNHPQFFTSHQMADTVKSGDIMALDPNHFCEELYSLLADEAEDLLDVIRTTMSQQPFQLICQRLLHHLNDNKLLDFLSGILGQSYSQHQLQQLLSANSFGPVSSPGGTAAWVTNQLDQCLQLIIFGCIRWKDLGSLSTHAALAFRFQQLHSSWQGSGKLQDIYNAAQLICNAEAAAVHWALLKFNARDSISTMYQDMLHSLWAVQCTIQHWSSHSDEQQIVFLADAGIHAAMLSSGQHSILRPSKKRKSHKHKRRKSHKKSRKSREMLPSSGEESLSDNDLGIMTPDAGDRMPQAAGNWLIHMGRPESSQVQTSAQGLPAVLLHQVLSGWTEYCFTLL